ncbi:MAG: hypothetical protein GYB65_21940, partial [Chloroflexi bacterium]|nr:hypothetical protein [Chloroflexota bacterium]
VTPQERAVIVDYLSSPVSQPDVMPLDEQQLLQGDALVALRCGDCHSRQFLAGVEGTSRSPDGWATAVDRMIDYGVVLTPAERDLIVNYLSSLEPDDLLAPGESRMQASEYDALYGDALVNLRCTDCHGRTLVAGVAPDSRGRAEWAATVDRMISYGLRLTPDERETIINYLAGQ